MSYYPDKKQIPAGFEEWSFSNMPEDGEVGFAKNVLKSSIKTQSIIRKIGELRKRILSVIKTFLK